MQRALRFHCNPPKNEWPRAFKAVFYLNVRISIARIGDKTPYEVLNGVPPNLSNLRAFGCLSWGTTAPEQQDKEDEHAHFHDI